MEKEKEVSTELSRLKSEGNMNDYTKLSEKWKKQKEKEFLKSKTFLLKQEKVFFISFYILFNLAEDVNTERKMIKKGLLNMLTACLQPIHTSIELVELVLRFLKKVSIYEENKNLLKTDLNIIELLLKYISCSSENIIKMTLRLLFNLSFDKVSRCF
jgi:hypothetical protein